MQHAADFGLKAEGVGYDQAAVVKRSRAVAGRLNNGVSGLLKKNKVAVIWGEAQLEKPGEVTVAKSSRPPVLPALPAPRGAGRGGDLSR